MPYSITTRDGITISGIPDDMPPDHPDLKARVAAIRGGSAQPADPVPASAPRSGFVMGLRDPVDAGAQMLEHLVPDGVATAVNRANNWLADRTGLVSRVPETPTGTSDMVKAVNRQYDKQRNADAGGLTALVTGQKPEPGFDWARIAGNMLNPVNLIGGAELRAAQTVPQLMIQGGKAGAVGGMAQPVLNDEDGFWQVKAGQAAAGMGAGAVLSPIAARATEAAARGIKTAADAARSRVTPAQPLTADGIAEAIRRTLAADGMDVGVIPKTILDSVQRQMQEATAAGRQVDPAALVRIAQAEALGLRGETGLTAGQATRNPTQFANEKNLSQVRITTPTGEGNPLADRFNAQAGALNQFFDARGASGATDRVTAGQTFLDALRAADAPVKAGVDDLYNAARAMNNGRAAELNRGHFSQAANSALDQGMLGHFLPAEVRNLLNGVSDGSTPFTVETATQLDSLFSAAQRKAARAGDDAAGLAIGKVRDALHATPLVGEEAAGVQRAAGQVVGEGFDRSVPAVRGRAGGEVSLPMFQMPGAKPAADTGAAAREAFAQARRAARDRFATIEATPALKAALDEAAPDKFVQQFILGADVRDVQAMRGVLANSPEAMGQARAQIADHLKRAAFGENLAGDGKFSPDRYAKTLRAMGRDKLLTFFSPEEVVQLGLAGRVMADLEKVPAGATPNLSGTGGAVMNLLSTLANSGPMRNIPLLRPLANQVGEMKSERAMRAALSATAQAPKQPTKLDPETVRSLYLLFAPAAVAGGSLGGAAAQ